MIREFIPDPDSDFFLSWFTDAGVKTALVPGSATLFWNSSIGTLIHGAKKHGRGGGVVGVLFAGMSFNNPKIWHLPFPLVLLPWQGVL
jgi:hypothetical protein